MWYLVIAPAPISVSAEVPLDEVVVVATSLLGEALMIDVPANVQVIGGEELRKQGALDITELMNRNLGSVSINEAQSNPL